MQYEETSIPGSNFSVTGTDVIFRCDVCGMEFDEMSMCTLGGVVRGHDFEVRYHDISFMEEAETFEACIYVCQRGRGYHAIIRGDHLGAYEDEDDKRRRIQFVWKDVPTNVDAMQSWIVNHIVEFGPLEFCA